MYIVIPAKAGIKQLLSKKFKLVDSCLRRNDIKVYSSERSHNLTQHGWTEQS